MVTWPVSRAGRVGSASDGSVCDDAAVSQLQLETEVVPAGEGRWTVTPSPAWSIGDNANGGYVTALVLRAAVAAGGHVEPLSVTTHFLRPLQPDGSPAEIEIEVVRTGRTATVVRGTLRHAGKDRVVVLAALGDLSTPDVAATADTEPSLTVVAPELPSPEDCIDRSTLEQGVALPILERVDVRIDPPLAEPGGADRAVMQGWIRLADGTPPDALTLALFADAFPPSLYPRFGRIGWVPTLELTVQVRRRPAPGWVLARLECDDLANGLMIETGTLWGSDGALVARSRQLGMLLAETRRP